MSSFIKVAEYIKQNQKSRASVYRDIKRGKIKTTQIDGVTHIIIEKNQINSETSETSEIKNKNSETIIKEAEVVDNTPNIKYEIEFAKTSITALEDFANRIEAAKEETISKQDETIERQNKNIDSLNETIQIVSKDNNDLRIQLAIRDTELHIRDNEIEKIKSYETELRQQIQKINNELEEELIKVKKEYENIKTSTIKEQNNNQDNKTSWLKKF